MLFRHENDAIPVIAGQQDQPGIQVLRARRDREVHLIIFDQFGDLLRGALVQLEIDLRITLREIRE